MQHINIIAAGGVYRPASGKAAEMGGSLSALAAAHDPAVVPAQATVGKAGLVDKV